MKVTVVCPYCGNKIEWVWGNYAYKCDSCGNIVGLKEARLDESARRVFLPG